MIDTILDRLLWASIGFDFGLIVAGAIVWAFIRAYYKAGALRRD